jgi:hypothetical protein
LIPGEFSAGSMSGTASAIQGTFASSKTGTQMVAEASGPMLLSLRIVRGPLTANQDEEIVRKYNQLTSSHIPIEEFRRWAANGPEGPAWHGLLEPEDGKIGGHICLIPFRTNRRGQKRIIAKAEYFFVEEQYRSMRVKGFEGSFKPPAILQLDQLYRHCLAEGWGPLLISASSAIQPLHLLVGCRSVDFPLVECLFILRPWNAAVKTPNLTVRQRIGVFLAGCAQIGLWAAAGRWMRPNNSVQQVPTGGGGEVKGEVLAFFEDEESIRWRYPEKGYVRFALEEAPEEFAISKRGSEAGYLRVCQWEVSDGRSIKSLLVALLREARAEKALGVRWAVYGEEKTASWLTGQMKRLGFLCVRRTRRLLLYTKDKDYLRADRWKITDSLFSFDP